PDTSDFRCCYDLCLYHYLANPLSLFFFFNDTAPTQIYTLSLHDALPISTKPSITRRVATLWPLYPTALRSRAWATIGFSRETGDGWKAICSSVLSINDIFDIELDIRDPDEMVRTVCALEPAFRGSNLEDTEPPDC